MSGVTSALMTCDRLQNNGRKLPPGVHGMGELMVRVLARYGLEIVEDGDQQTIAAASPSVRHLETWNAPMLRKSMRFDCHFCKQPVPSPSTLSCFRPPG